MAELQWAELDGVRTLWKEVPGPFVGSLSFRVGQSDEDLPIGG